jgi:hypothetical protein
LKIKAEKCTGDMQTSIAHFFLCLSSGEGFAYDDESMEKLGVEGIFR